MLFDIAYVEFIVNLSINRSHFLSKSSQSVVFIVWEIFRVRKIEVDLITHTTNLILHDSRPLIKVCGGNNLLSPVEYFDVCLMVDIGRPTPEGFLVKFNFFRQWLD